MNWYKRYPGDFAAKTRHLSLAERGAYDALLDHYYATMSPLPVDVRSLCRITGAQGEAEEAAVRRVAAEFFEVHGDGTRHNKRADEEIAKWKSKEKSRSKGGVTRSDKLTTAERQSIARQAAAARWGQAG